MSDALTSHATSPVPVSPTHEVAVMVQRVVYVTVGAMTVGWAVGWLAVHVGARQPAEVAPGAGLRTRGPCAADGTGVVGPGPGSSARHRTSIPPSRAR